MFVAGAAGALGASTAAAWCDQEVLAEQLSSVASLRYILPEQVCGQSNQRLANLMLAFVLPRVTTRAVA